MNLPMMSREERWALLAAADVGELVETADVCLAAGPDPVVVTAPRVGCVSVPVREPVMSDRFLLGDVLACEAEVEFGGARGWGMRLGDDRAAVLAMAILDAAAEADPSWAAAIDELCRRIAERLEREAEGEWAELAGTIVEFEEL
jgi:alpha-D-ribose 1-methylphosphonate 5-triphosphate synthase subunit PhnG